MVRVAGLDDAGPGDLSFLANPKYRASLTTTRATAVIVGEDVTGAPCAVLRAANPYLAFARAIRALSPAPPRPAPGIHPTAVVADDAVLDEDVSVGPYVVIGARARLGARTLVHPHVVIGADVETGPDCLFHAHVSIREGCRLGARVVLQDGAVIGGDGFGFAPRGDGTYEKIPQLATVVIEDDVEVGANATIDRPAVGETRIGAGTKIDNLVQVAHGVQVGRNVLLAAQVGIAGSSVLEDNVMLGGQVGVTGHITLGKGAMASAQTGITNSVEAGVLVSGYPAIPNREWLKASVLVRKLPELKQRVADLEARLAALEAARR